jgi:hypothetical protein
MGSKAKGKEKKKKRNKFATYQPRPQTKIPSPEELLERIPYHKWYPAFCFRYYQYDDKLSIARFKRTKDFVTFFERITSLSTLTWGEIEQSGNYHAHEIEDWRQTSRKSGFDNLANVPKGFPGYQFKVFGECRIIGFFTGPIFYIVWIDRAHKLYPRK